MNSLRTVVAALGLLFASACGAGTKANGAASSDEEAPDGRDGGTEPRGVEPGAGSDGEPSTSEDPVTQSGEPSDTDAGGADDTPTLDGADPIPADPLTEPEGTPDEALPSGCPAPEPGRAPLRRLTRFEYDNTIRDLLDDDSRPAQQFALETGRYGNNADEQFVAAYLAEQYGAAAKDVVARALSNAEVRARNFACLDGATAGTETSCARSIIESFGARAFRRPLDAETIEELVDLQADLREQGTFEESIASMLEAMLQGPDFLYRLEFGVADAGLPDGLRRLSGHEMATRLSYLLWGTLPDLELSMAAQAGELDTASGVLTHATRMLEDPRPRLVLRHFFDGFLGLDVISSLALDPDVFPEFSGMLPALMHQESLGFMEHEIFEGSGSWRGVLTAPYVFVNEELARHYGIEGVTGPEFRAVDVDPDSTHRFGLLTQGSVLVKTLSLRGTNPFRRGHLIAVRLMCEDLPPPPDDLESLVPPTPSDARTTRELWEQSTLSEPACAGCHQHTDPIGFAFENYDAVALWREDEDGAAIDTAASTPLLGDFDGPRDLVAKVAAHDRTYSCFADNWAEFAYGRTLDVEEDACVVERLRQAFSGAEYDVRALLLESTQTDAFLFLPTEGTP